ncbi:MAG: Gfo/Idh/MocA family oxidoreductase [Aigarchaeota archaeon]|nr:Gfo/Idh/MocA family oxidoreductase [Aigarchaeota archaeon]
MVKKVRFGVVGLGNIGSLHVDNIQRSIDEAEVIALAETRKDVLRQISDRYGIERRYKDYSQLAKDEDVDAVIIALPSFMHCEAVKIFAESYKHVFCEKPMALTLEEADDVISMVDKHGIKLQVGYNRRFDEAYMKAKELIEKGDLGAITLARSNTRDPVPPSGWEKDPKLSGGTFIGTCTHDFDILRWLIGSESEEVYASQAFFVYEDLKKLGYPDNVMVMIRFRSGTMAEVDASRNCAYGYDVRTEVFGTKGAVRIEKEKELDLLVFDEGGVRHDYPYWFAKRFPEAYLREVKAFTKCIFEDTKPSVTAEDARAVLEMAIAAAKSAQSGKTVKLPLDYGHD